MPEILPCPLCGRSASEDWEYIGENANKPNFYISCDWSDCVVRTVSSYGVLSPDITKAWNTRAEVVTETEHPT